MAHEGRPYSDILIDAQELGYAEADPSGDVEGDDAVNKLVILARLGFGAWLDPDSVVRRPPTVRGTGDTRHHRASAIARWRVRPPWV